MNFYSARKYKFAVLKERKNRKVEKLSHAHNKYENIKSRKYA